jgi:hypothetical protein
MDKTEKTKDKLERLRALRVELRQTIEDRLAELETEKKGMIAMYDDEMEKLRGELQALGVTTPVGTHLNRALADEIIRILQDAKGNWMSAREINRRTKSTAVLTVVLAKQLDEGTIEREGNSYRAVTPQDLSNDGDGIDDEGE